ncbi:MAG: ketopantoate reductase family protein [Tahibacter sp.]
MRVLVLGAGATGAYYGARMIQGGSQVDFLVRPERARQLRADGLRIHSSKGDFSDKVPVLTDVPRRGSYDIVLLSCKSYDLDSAIAAIAPAVGEETRVLPLLNGLRHLELLDLAFGRRRVWGGVCHISVTRQDDGSIRQFGQLDRLTFGARDEDSAMAQLICSLLAVPVDTRHSAAILDSMWEKFAFLATLAGLTCAMRASIGEIVAAPGGTDLLRRCYSECAEIASILGHAIVPEARDEADAILTMANSPLKASMLRDLERGGRTEAEHILGDMLTRGQAAALDTPVLAACCLHLRIHELRRMSAPVVTLAASN